MKKFNQKISYVFSFRNEDKVLNELVTRLNNVNKKNDYQYEMIFIDDDSTDHSLEILKKLRLDNGNLKIIKMSRRFGVGPCVMAGFRKATGDVIIYMDSDLQDPPEIIPQIIEKYMDGYEVVHTKRVRRKGENKIKMFITKMAYKFIRKFSAVNIMENVGDYKLISKKVKNNIIDIQEYDPFIRGLSSWVGYKQAVIEYERDERYAGETHFSIFSNGPINEFIRGIFSNSNIPMLLSIIMGIIGLFIGFFILFIQIILKIVGSTSYGVTTIIMAIVIFSSIILISNGIQGIYITRIYDQIKGRPMYIIEEEIG